jgi:hypothetical protein
MTAEPFGTRTPTPVAVLVTGVAGGELVQVWRELTGHPPAPVRGRTVPAPAADAGPAVNLAANPTLTTDGTGWFTRWYGTTGAGTTARDAAAARTGTHGWRKTWTTGAGASSSDTGVAYGSTGAAGDAYAITPGTAYRVGMWLRSSRATVVRSVLQWYTAAGATVGAPVIGPAVTAPAGTWVHVGQVATAPATATRAYHIGGPRYVDAGTAPAAWLAGDTLDADDAELRTATGTVLVHDTEAPVGRPLVYVAEVTRADGRVVQLSAPALVIPDPGRHVLSDPGSGRAVLVDAVADADPRTTELRASVLHPAGRARPVVLSDTRSSDTGTLTVYTRDLAETAELVDLLAAGTAVVSRPPATVTDLPAVEVLAVLGATRARRTRAGDRVWQLPFVVVDTPDPTLPVTLTTLSTLATYYATGTLSQLGQDFTTLLGLARDDLGTG